MNFSCNIYVCIKIFNALYYECSLDPFCKLVAILSCCYTLSPLFNNVVSIYNDGCEVNNCNNLNLYCVNEVIKIVTNKRSVAPTGLTLNNSEFCFGMVVLRYYAHVSDSQSV